MKVVVLVDGERVVYELPLPLGGIMTRGSVEEAAGREDELRRELVARGYPHHEPLYTLFFLAALLAYAAWARRRGPGRYALVTLLFALGLLAIQVVVVAGAFRRGFQVGAD